MAKGQTVTHLMMDIDGVLVKGRPQDGCHWKTDLLADLGISTDELRRYFFAPYWSEIVTGQRGLRETLTRVLPEFAPQISAEQLIAYWFSNDAGLDLALLADLRKARTAGLSVWLATNQDHERARFLWQDLGLHDHANGMIWSAKLGVAKPDPEFFEMAAKTVGAKADTCLLVDDSVENVTAARRAGWRGIHWYGRSTWADVLKEL